MRTASVSDLKAHLARYLREVKRGNEVQILERGKPVARLVGMREVGGEDCAQRERLIAAGAIRPGTGGASAILEEPPLRLVGADLSRAIDQDRDERV